MKTKLGHLKIDFEDKVKLNQLINKLPQNLKIAILPTEVGNKIISEAINQNLFEKQVEERIFNILSLCADITTLKENTKNKLKDDKVVISSKFWKKRISKNYNTFNKIRNFLSNIDVLEWHSVSNANDKYTTNSYKLNYSKADYSLYYLLETEKQTQEIIKEKRQEFEEQNLKPKIINTLIETKLNFNNVLIDEYNFHKENETSTDNFIYRINKAAKFMNISNRYYKIKDEKGRAYSSFTNLSKVTRQHLYVTKNKFGKNKFYSIDLANAQPILLLLFAEECKKVDTKNKKYNFILDENYIEDTQNGVIFDKIFKQLKEDNKTKYKIVKYGITYKDIICRDDVKPIYFSEIFFDFKTTKNNHINRIFGELYPKTYKSIELYHKNSGYKEAKKYLKDFCGKHNIYYSNDVVSYQYINHIIENMIGVNVQTKKRELRKLISARKVLKDSLARKLQELEAKIFLSLRPKESKYFFTIHDSIYFTKKKDEKQLVNKIEKYFGDIKITLKNELNEKIN